MGSPALTIVATLRGNTWSRAAALLPGRLALVGLGTLLLTGTFATSLAIDAAGSASGRLALLECTLFAASLGVLVPGAAMQELPQASRHGGRRAIAARLGSVTLLVALGVSAVVSLRLAGELLVSASDPTVYGSDAAAFNHFDAQLVLQGVNPYTADGQFLNALRQFPSAGATPLRGGTTTGGEWGPSLAQVRRDVALYVADPAQHKSEFSPQSLHSYPALAFLVDVPAVWAGAGSTMLVSLLALVGLMAALVFWLPRQYRVVGGLVLLANWPAVLLTLKGGFEAVALLPAVLAWQLIGRKWLSPVLLGLACAVKQIVWPLALLYLVYCAWRFGWRDAFGRSVVVIAAFLVPNLPFIVLSPGAWAHSMLLPMTMPLYSDGVGLVALARAGLLPLWSPTVYSVLEALALAAIVAWYALRRPQLRAELALVLGLLPFALAWRSLFNYFVWLPALALIVAATHAAWSSLFAVAQNESKGHHGHLQWAHHAS